MTDLRLVVAISQGVSRTADVSARVVTKSNDSSSKPPCPGVGCVEVGKILFSQRDRSLTQRNHRLRVCHS